jgi:hypothetical protein
MSRYRVHGSWSESYTSNIIGAYRIEVADCVDKRTNTVYTHGAYRVVRIDTGKPAKVGKGGTVPFYGEMAWADAERLANDLYWADRTR